MNMSTGDFSGTGYYHTGSPTWTVSGNATDSQIAFTIDYDASSYYVDAEGAIASDGSMSGDAASSYQTFTWSTTSGRATFQRYAEITKPDVDEVIFGSADFEAYLLDNDLDAVQWAVRKGTCAAGTNTVFGNVDGHSDPYSWSQTDTYKYEFSATADTSSWVPGMYCFIFNPREDSGESNIRLTRQFYVADGYVKGGGQIIEDVGGAKKKENYRISFGGNVWDLGSAGYKGNWEINFHNVGGDGDTYGLDKTKFHTTRITDMNLYVGNNTSCHAALNFTAYGWLGNDHSQEYKVIFRAGDYIEPGHRKAALDTIRIQLFNPSGTGIYDTHDDGFLDESSCVGSARTGLDNGNITIGL
jgi:hypothetical protein